MYKSLNTSIINLALIFGIATISNASTKSEITVGTDAVKFNRHENDFISGSEPSRWLNYNLSGYVISDINDKTSYSVNGKYVNYYTGDIEAGRIEDDSLKAEIGLELSLISRISSDSLFSFGVNYNHITNIQEENDSNKNNRGFNFSYVSDYDNLTYMLTAGKITHGSFEVQDAIIEAEYAGLGLNYKYNDKLDIGISYDYFIGDHYDENVLEIEAIGHTISLYGEYKINNNLLTVGYKHYDMSRQDISDSFGDIEDAKGQGIFVSYSIPFGAESSKQERMLMTQKPNISEFTNFAGSVMD